MVNPDRIADDFCRETMTVIARPAVLHGTIVSVRGPSWQCLIGPRTRKPWTRPIRLNCRARLRPK
jgi:hypothetical protein